MMSEKQLKELKEASTLLMQNEWIEEARRQDAKFRQQQVAWMAGQSREALRTLLTELTDQMPPSSAEAGYWYIRGFLEAMISTFKGSGEKEEAL